MPAVPLDGFPPAFFPRCPKCDSGSLHFQRTKHPFMWGKTDLQFSCFTCGLVKYGEPAIRQAFEAALAKWERQGKEEAAFQVSVDKERAERVAREVEATRLRREQEARQQVEVEAKRAKEAKEAARLAREQKKAQAQAQEEAERKVREEQERIVHERDAARLAREQELARERAARWAEIEVMRKRDAERQANLQRELKRERDARYREKKRGGLAASPVAVLPVPAPLPTVSVVAEVEGVVEEVGSVSLPMCAWTGCVNHATPTSKYCSRTCNNHNAHARAAARAGLVAPKAKKAKDAKKATGQLRKEVLARKAHYEARTTTESV